MGDGIPSAGNVVPEGEKSDEGTAHVDRHLHDVGPDDSCYAALEGIKQREGGDDADGDNVAGADGNGNNDGHSEHADTFRRGTGEQEKTGGDFVQKRTETAVDELIGREHIPGEIAGQKQSGDHDAPEEVAEHDLQEAEVARKGNAGNGDDGKRGGFGGDDGKGNGPPGDRIAGKEVGLQ